jgi:hypothetical protein
MSLNNDMRQNIQSNLDFSSLPTGEARMAGREGSESLRTMSAPESPATTERTMEKIVERENLKEALRRVKANKGAPGVDGMTVNQLDDHPETALASHPGTTAKRNIQTKSGEAGRDTEAGWRSAQVGHPDSAGSIHPASGHAGSATAVGPGIFRSQLRFSTAKIGASGRSTSTAAYC